MRRALALLCVLLLGATSAAVAQTGDEQYQDPFADETTRSGQGTGTAPPLTDVPPVTPPATTPTTPTTPPSTAGPAQTGSMPRTGADAWLLALLGAGVALSGVGLRLRTTDERF